MGLREQIIWGAKVMTDARIVEVDKMVAPMIPVSHEMGELLRQLGMPEFSCYKKKITFNELMKRELPTAERVHEFLQQKRKELWQRQQPLPYKQQ